MIFFHVIYAILALFASRAHAAAVNVTSRAVCGDPGGADTIANLRRLYNPTLTDHFLTLNGIDEAIYTTQMGYQQQGDPTTSGIVSTSGLIFFNQAPGTVPFFRLYNSATSTHLFTTPLNGVSAALASGYAYEGCPFAEVVGWVYITDDCPGVVPYYWAHSDALTDNFYTVFLDQYNEYIAKGYTGMGPVAYIFPPS